MKEIKIMVDDDFLIEVLEMLAYYPVIVENEKNLNLEELINYLRFIETLQIERGK